MADAKAPARDVALATETGFSSSSYWITRYKRGKSSGSGSYGRLAEYKAAYINNLVARLAIASVVEFGSGDGNQASLFDIACYTGVDVSPEVVAACRARFADRPGWAFLQANAFNDDPHDMAMSLDVIYHLIEEEVYDAYMCRLFQNARRHVLIYSSDHEAGTTVAHVRHRSFSEWVAANQPGWRLLESPEQPYPYTRSSDPKLTSFASFKLYAAQ